MSKLNEGLINQMPNKYALQRYHFWWHTSAGAFCRWLLLVWTAICFADARTWFILGPALFGVAYIPAMAIHRRVYGFYKFLYGPRPSHLLRSYIKLWGIVQNGPIQKTIKQP